jgi:hypothetical protein
VVLAWVAADGDVSGKDAISGLQGKFKTWSADHFRTWSQTDFELLLSTQVRERNYQRSRFAMLTIRLTQSSPFECNLILHW